jgi:hypothetical protein
VQCRQLRDSDSSAVGTLKNPIQLMFLSLEAQLILDTSGLPKRSWRKPTVSSEGSPGVRP